MFIFHSLNDIELEYTQKDLVSVILDVATELPTLLISFNASRTPQIDSKHKKATINTGDFIINCVLA